MEAYLQKLWERSYEQMRIAQFCNIMILVKSTLNKMVAMATCEIQK